MRLCPVCGYRMDPVLEVEGYTRHPNCARWTPLEKAARAQARIGLPEKPYTQLGSPSAGWSGTDTSQEAEPIRAESQRAVLGFVEDAGYMGATVVEAREALGLHHGITSGALSVLHKRGRLARLTTKRGRCRVYVMPDLLNGREAD